MTQSIVRGLHVTLEGVRPWRNYVVYRYNGVCISIGEVDSLAASLGCTSDSIPFIYLGLPVGKKIRCVDGWDEVVDRFRVRLSSWKAKNLSIGGHFTLVKYVLGFNDSSSGLLGKWKRRFHNEKEALWFHVISEFYGEYGGFSSLVNSYGLGGTWCDILKGIKDVDAIDPPFKNSFIIKVGNGSSTLLWKDQWCGSGNSIMDIFPRLYALDTFKDFKVSDSRGLVNDTWGGAWSRHVLPKGRSLDDISSLISLIGNLRLCSSSMDKWPWTGD
ncbi:hypothetical protein Tco_0133867 [Tanacetum coccineum]